jgi:3D-(3,5/4)-trihydroxycyclohexane-1,2-dione acylhydrolase (decyclizing)
MKTRRMTMAQALVAFLKNQHVRRDGKENAFFGGVWGIFGHGNVAGVAQGLQENKDLPYYLTRNEQAMVHTAAAYAKMSNRLRAFACTSSIGPGATNMVTGAATATINRLPVLLLPGDIFSRRNVAPVLQQLESEQTQDISVNDAFKPVSRYWDRINRADQLPFALLETMRVLTSPAQTGAVTLGLPQDVQTEAWDYPEELFEKRVWDIPRVRADRQLLNRAAEWIRKAKRPLIVTGGGVLYSEATEELRKFVEATGIAVGETQAGKGALPFDHPQNLGPIGVTGTPGANILAREADLVINIGTRLSDFTTASKTAFQNPGVRFIGINVCELDAHKHAALPLLGDAKATLQELADIDYQVSADYREKVSRFKREWEAEVDRLFHLGHGVPVAQSEVIGLVNQFSEPRDVVVCAAGSLPGELHKLWRTRDPKGYHLEYGYSCMGYEIAGGLGVKMADPSREVYVMVGDGSYLMMCSEIVTSIQEGYKLNIILLNNHGFGSIGGLSKSVGSCGFGTDYKFRNKSTGELDGDLLGVDFQSNAASMGAHAQVARNLDELGKALEKARSQDRTTVTVMEIDKHQSVPGYESWWDVPVSEVSTMDSVREAREKFEKKVKEERIFL